MTDHPDIEAFVIGTMDRDLEIDAHLAACAECAAKLAREARLELALREVPLRKQRRVIGVVLPFVALAAAAALLLFVRHTTVDGPEVRPAMGEVAIPDAEEVLKTLRPEFRRCYQAGLAADHTLSGKVVIAAVVAGDGAVRSATADSVEGLTPPVTECLVEVVRRAHFTGVGQETTVRFPVSFVAR